MSNGSEHEEETPSQGAIHHSYVIPGLTDGQVMKTQAEKNVAHGRTTWVHKHPRIGECTEDCQLFEPAKKEN